MAVSRRVVSLGTSARVLKANMLANYRATASHDDHDVNFTESTQPMSNVDLDLASTQPMCGDEDANLFAFTQAAAQQTVNDALDEFVDLSKNSRSSDVQISSRPIREAPMQRINSELIPGPFMNTFAMRRPPLRRSMKRNLSETTASGEQSDIQVKRGSKLSLSSLKRKSFLRGWRKRKTSDSTPSSDASSVIPPLRERLSAQLMVHATDTNHLTPQKQRRKSNELYSPWIKNRLHFLKKYRVGSVDRRIASCDKASKRALGSTPKARISLPKHFSPGWSRANNINSEFGQHSKAQLIIRSTKNKFTKSASFKINPSKLTISQLQSKNEQPARTVCPFYMPSGQMSSRSRDESASPFIVCNNCGHKMPIDVTEHLTPHQEKKVHQPTAVAVESAPCPVMHDKVAYWPEAHQHMLPPHTPLTASYNQRKTQLTVSPAPTSIISFQPSCIPQTWSLSAFATQIEPGNTQQVHTDLFALIVSLMHIWD